MSLFAAFAGCQSITDAQNSVTDTSATTPRSLGEESSGYTYVPIDSIPISERPGRSCGTEDAAALETRDLYELPRFVLPRAAASRLDSLTTDLLLQQIREQLSAGKSIDDVLKGIAGRTGRPNIFYRPFLSSLPDNAVRISVEQLDRGGTLSYGLSSIGARNDLFRVTVDYTITDTRTFPLFIKKIATNAPEEYKKGIPVSRVADPAWGRLRYEVMAAKEVIDERDAEERALIVEERDTKIAAGYSFYSIPIYVGVGLRVVSTIRVLEANTRIEGLGVIGVEAEQGRLSGSLVIQTLGINGESISAALPIQSELNRTTVQNAIVSVSSIKTLLYKPDVALSPRVVGLYLPFPATTDLVNQIVSVLAEKSPIVWKRPCERLTDGQGRQIALGNTPQ